tara:strand:- start:191 stop:1456 length:1266 start_codon:yes stop_codon:yes gene_type:complete
MNVLTACSGIGAPEHAWRDLPFNFIGCSEIEAFPSAVLKHHYPNVTNYGDMNNYRDWKIDEPITALFAGTPCQSFSVAGLRQGMDSPNGNLALVYLGMVERFAPRWVIWENVPGVLSSNGGRDFGSFLGALGQLRYSYAYRVLDAQYFGVPQRRRRVFVVGHISDWRCAAAVLFEPTSLSGDITKSQKKGKTVAPAVTTGAPYARTGNERVEADALVVNRMLSFGDYVESDYTSTLQALEAKDVSDIVMQPLYRETDHGNYTDSDTAGTLLAQQSKQAVDLVYENHAQDSRVKQVDVCPTAAAKWGTGGGNVPLVQSANQTQWPAKVGNTLGADWEDKMGLNDQHINAGAPYFIPQRNQVRRILPIEAERLQGFTDGYTDITYRGKPAPDSQRYKALGNSMAVPVVRWIGNRIAEVEKANA